MAVCVRVMASLVLKSYWYLIFEQVSTSCFSIRVQHLQNITICT